MLSDQPINAFDYVVPPSIVVDKTAQGQRVRIAGTWVVSTLAEKGQVQALRQQLAQAKVTDQWDLTGLNKIDHFGAQLLWQLWGRARPAALQLQRIHEDVFDRLQQIGSGKRPQPDNVRWQWLVRIGLNVFAFGGHLKDFITLVGQLVLDLMRFARAPHRGPWKEISATIYSSGVRALGITALVGFLIGVVLSFLSAQQLKLFGADIFIVNILGLSIVRELGPVLAAILVAGRSGSAMTAQLGVMRVTEELDAMLVMGIPHGFRLIMPKVIALAIVMPLLVLWTDAMALAGGALSARFELGLSFHYFFQSLPDAVSLPNFFIGIGKGVVFGMLIALVACHFGLRIQPNTESLGRGTTSSVVTAITAVILADAVFAILFKDVGL